MIFLQPYMKYTDFSGRAGRMEYWTFFIFQIIMGIVLPIVENILGINNTGQFGIISSLFMLITLIPSLAVAVRRLHDTNRRGWWSFIVVIPVIGVLWFFILCLLDSTPGNNRFGKNPKSE